MARTLSAVANAVHGRLTGADSAFGDVSTDTRTLSSGALFIALTGERHDGNDYVEAACTAGAAGALVSRLTATALPQITVADTRVAFGTLAKAWRENFSVPVIAVTGSSGKTTVKELIASILSIDRRVCVTRGNLNNEIGVPITLMRCDDRDDAFVIELGANHAGEIDYLSSIVEPTIGVITNAGPAHLDGFGSLEGVAAAKGELLDHLPRTGTAVLNADDPFWASWRDRAGKAAVVSFGLSPRADCTVLGKPKSRIGGAHFEMRLPGGSRLSIELPLLGMHNVVNALAAAAAAQAAGASDAEIASGLARVAPVAGRLRSYKGPEGSTLIDDSYNANPASVRAAVDLLAALDGRRVLVLGDMAELGPSAIELHRTTGAYAAGKIDCLVAVGELAAHAAAGFGAAGRACNSQSEVMDALEPWLGTDATILIKGSRVMGLEKVVSRLLERGSEGARRC